MDARRLNTITLRPYKFKENEVITLLKLYKKHECLWNNQKPEYRNKYSRGHAYTQIIQGLGIDVTEVDLRKKIKGLRTTYNEELRKISNSIKSGAVGNDVHQPSVFWFELADSFLRKVAENRNDAIWNKGPEEDKEDIETEDQAFSNVGVPDYQDQDNQNEAPQINKKTTETEGQSFSNISLPDYQEQDEADYVETPDNDHQYFEPPELISRPRKRHASPEITTEQGKPEDETTKEDEIDLFGRFVVMQLKKLPEMASLKVMKDFHRILINARMESHASIANRSFSNSNVNSPNSNIKTSNSIRSDSNSSTIYNLDNYPSISGVYSVTGIQNKITRVLTDIYKQSDPLSSN